MAVTLYMVRHGAHDLVGQRLAGRLAGVRLNAEGMTQAERMAGRLAREQVTAVQAGPLERAQDTAAPIAERLGLAVDTVPALDEIQVGSWTGQSFAELADEPAWQRWNAARSVNRPPGGESMLEVQARVIDHIERLSGGVVLVSHQDVIKAALVYFLGLSFEAMPRLEVAPGSLTTVAVGDWGARLVGLNEVPA